MTNTRKPSTDRQFSVAEHYSPFCVVVEEVIGEVQYGTGDKHPTMLAMEIVAGYVTDHRPREATFSFPDPHGDKLYVTVKRSES